MRESRAFRRIIVLLLLAIVIVAQTYIFWYFWNTHYSQGMTREFFFKGHIVMLFVYGLMFTIFCNVYGAFKLGSLQYSNLVFSQILALLFTNFIIYRFRCYHLRWLVRQQLSEWVSIIFCAVLFGVVWQ